MDAAGSRITGRACYAPLAFNSSATWRTARGHHRFILRTDTCAVLPAVAARYNVVFAVPRSSWLVCSSYRALAILVYGLLTHFPHAARATLRAGHSWMDSAVGQFHRRCSGRLADSAAHRAGVIITTLRGMQLDYRRIIDSVYAGWTTRPDAVCWFVAHCRRSGSGRCAPARFGCATAR